MNCRCSLSFALIVSCFWSLSVFLKTGRFWWAFFRLVEPEEIKRLGKRFRKLDLDNSGSLSIDEFMSLPELQQNPLVQRVIDIFDADGNGEVDFKGREKLFPPQNFTKFPNRLSLFVLVFIEFIQGVSQFSVKGDKESKLRFAFRIYDMDNDGYISNGELFQVTFHTQSPCVYCNTRVINLYIILRC